MAFETRASDIFADFAPPVRPGTPLRAAITAAYRRPEPECLAPLVAEATLPAGTRAAAEAIARRLVTALRGKNRSSGVEALVQEYSLSSQEGVALMCLAEALLRIPDTETRDALIRDKIAGGDWAAHLGGQKSLFVNAATWGLVVTGRLTSTVNDRGLAAALTRVVARCGEPVVRRGVDMAMRMMGEQFVTGETIAEALKRARPLEAQGFRYSYDMLGEAATTAADAERYYKDYERAIRAIGAASAGRGPYAGPGISIKLSALHPRYARAQAGRVMGELLPRVKRLALLAKSFDIGFNIDAEEADRLEISLDLLESLALDADLAGWNGLGFVVQAYGRRCPFVLDWIIDLATRANRRIMVRLVKGAYWDAEIKRAQVDGLPDFPVYTRKIHTDVAYIACARPTTPRRWRRSTPWRASRSPKATGNSSACTAWASRSTRRWSGAASSGAPAGSMRRSAPTRRCSPIWFAACWRTAPTRPSFTGSPTRRCRSTSWWLIPWRSWPPSLSPARRMRGSRCRAISMAPAATPPGSTFPTRRRWPDSRAHSPGVPRPGGAPCPGFSPGPPPAARHRC
jgi:proline dehydrogenase